MSDNNTYNWTEFTRKMFIQAPVEEVFRAWATPHGLETWFIATATYTTPDGQTRPTADFYQPGDCYHWRWIQENEASGQVLALEPNRCIEFTFGAREPGSEEQVKVNVTFSPDDQGGTCIELHQYNMVDTPASHVQWHLSCNMGWNYFMANLKAVLEHGIDLRETDPRRAAEARAITH